MRDPLVPPGPELLVPFCPLPAAAAAVSPAGCSPCCCCGWACAAASAAPSAPARPLPPPNAPAAATALAAAALAAAAMECCKPTQKLRQRKRGKQSLGARGTYSRNGRYAHRASLGCFWCSHRSLDLRRHTGNPFEPIALHTTCSAHGFHAHAPAVSPLRQCSQQQLHRCVWKLLDVVMHLSAGKAEWLCNKPPPLGRLAGLLMRDQSAQ